MSAQIHIFSFLINSPINHTVLSWADKDDNRLETLGSLRLWQNLARTMERGLFDGMFFADTPGVFDRYRDSHEDAAKYGVCWPSHDPVVLLSALAAGATHLGLAVGKPQIVGSPEQVAGQLEHIWRETGCYAYNLTPHIMPSSVEEFVDEVVPILQKKGIYRTEYPGTTFRENLGLA